MTIRDRLLDPGLTLTPAERKLARAILANYPVTGLGTVASLAGRAKVSDPTVVRFTSKLGFASFPSFQDALLSEVEERLRSPLMLTGRQPAGAETHPSLAYAQGIVEVLAAGQARVQPGEFDRAVEALIGCKGRVLTIGGRFSGFLAGILQAHLRQLRPGTVLLTGAAADQIDQLVDIGPRDLLVVFDYRRYQADVVAFARQAHERGARVLLFTDRWGSPVASCADIVLAADVEAPSLFDTMAPALVQLEALVSAMTERQGTAALRRIEAFETVRATNRVTETDGREPDGGSGEAR
ncbi:MurR/RpiR family transcriptional regulator [Phreatobacter cathodiphilus]|uniref:MurR/RpiR family transcriptional regulator n=1 Tax=Phreatobacter cathodiphilus TaxID=1868589 RepID=A0A2S0NGR4_9HYPH|nr:MurR/RpiR family transcriptional regulator [Phreatobacter cathodiphilus]AVO47093.1 MurR/RpiR family transcriptional regulator [Phreatobacter cathodiphilus]